MKTPREILLERHQRAKTKLDGIDPEKLAALARESTNVREKIAFSARIQSAFEGFWTECVLPWRRAWAGIAAVWIAIFALHLAARGSSSSTGNEMAATKNPQVLSALREQKQMLAQLLGPVATSTPAPTKNSGPRSEQRRELFIV
jgi:hypothetical protein